MRSRSERMRTLGAIQAALAGIALGATLLAIVVSYGVARTITRPLASITDHMRHIAATGDLTRKIPTKRQGGWDDDDAHMLATTFNTLTDSIVRFQREAGAARAAVVARPAVDGDRARGPQPADDHQGRAAHAGAATAPPPPTCATPRRTSTRRSIA